MFDNRIKLFPTFLLIVGVVFAVILAQVVLLEKYSFASPLIVVLNGLLFSTFLYILFFRNYLNIILIILSIIPLAYLSLSLHYSLVTVIIQDIPLLLLTGIVVVSSLVNINSLKIRFDTISIGIVLLMLYTPVMFILGVKNGHPKFYCLEEFYHIGYYFLFFVFLYSLKSARNYHKIFFGLFILAIILSIEFILFNIFGGFNRFVSFQAYILPLLSSITYSLFLMRKNSKLERIALAAITFIILLGIFITLTRTLWAASFISIGLITIVYFRNILKISKIKIFSLSLLVIIPLVFIALQIKPQKQSQKNTNDIEYRSQSMTNPGEDRSFLMRMELGYYIFQDFVKSPIIGLGLGSSVKYKYLGITNKPFYYPDNSWLFFLWKGGIIGFFIFVLIYYRGIRIAWILYKLQEDSNVRAIALGIFAGFLGMLFFGLFNAVLIKYKTTFLFPFFLAYLEFEYRKLANCNIESEK